MIQNEQTSAVRQLFTRGQPLNIAKGDVIIGNSKQPDGVYYLSSGFVKAYSISDDGDEYLNIIYGPGEVFPIIWGYLNIEPEGLFFEAISECTVWRIARTWFEAAVQTNLSTSYAMSTLLARQFDIYIDRVDNLEYKKASERIAYRLLFLANRFGVKKNNTITIVAPITHELFANSINLARESVSRELEKLEHENIIWTSNHQIIINDVASLVNKLSRPMNLANWNLV